MTRKGCYNCSFGVSVRLNGVYRIHTTYAPFLNIRAARSGDMPAKPHATRGDMGFRFWILVVQE